jgi:hypothetical protein
MGSGGYIEINEGANLSDVGEQLMEYYIRTVIEAKLPEIRKAVVQANPQVDSDYVATLVNQEIEKHIPEIKYKFNQVAMFLLDFVVRGQFGMLRDFESKFEDLIERTLLRHSDFSQFMAALRQKISDSLDKVADNPHDLDKPIGNA